MPEARGRPGMAVAAAQRAGVDGALEVESRDFERLLGQRATPVREALRQLVSDIRA